MSFSILERNDTFHPSNSYINVYKTNSLYKIETKYREIILRIVKKSILGSNFIYFYSKHGLFISAILNLIIINLNFLIFPKLLSQSKYIKFSEEEDDYNQMDRKSEIISPYNRLFDFNNTTNLLIHLFIINLFDVIIFSIIIIDYLYKHKKINKYMEKYTQCSIESENKLIKNYFNCVISNNGKFNIEIYSKKNKNNKENLNLQNINNNYFFEYVINLPNIRFLTHFIYKKIFLQKEKEIIDRIVGITNEIEYKYKKKLITFLLIIVSIIIYFPLMNYISGEKKKDFINYFGILILILFVERDNFFKNKAEQIQRVSLLNNEYINNGYYIYIDNDIISIFFVKEKFRNIEYIDKIKELNERFLYKYNLI